MGDADVALVEIDTYSARVEWVEGVGNRWTFWVFDSGAAFLPEDILTVAELDLAVVVQRFQVNATLRTKEFHHFEIRTEEHEKSHDEIVALIEVP